MKISIKYLSVCCKIVLNFYKWKRQFVGDCKSNNIKT